MELPLINALKNNFDKIILSVSDKNKAAIKLYEKFKFKIDKRYKIKKIGKLNLITMILKNKIKHK